MKQDLARPFALLLLLNDNVSDALNC